MPTSPTTSPRSLLAALALGILPAVASAYAPVRDPAAQDPKPIVEKGENGDKGDKGENGKDEKAKKPEWPALKYVRKSITRDKIPYLTSKSDEKRADAKSTILSYGPAVCPILMESVHDKQRPELNTELCALLDELTTAEHTPLLIEAYSPKNLALSRWIVQRIAAFEQKENKGFLEKAAQHEDAAIAETAQFALARLGDIGALPFLLRMAKEQWEERNVEVRTVLPALKGKEATKELASRLVLSKDPNERVACLRLLAGCGTQEAVAPIASLLDSSEHQIRVATVNALRGIVDGKRPYANLTVFNAITEVKAWKARLGR